MCSASRRSPPPSADSTAAENSERMGSGRLGVTAITARSAPSPDCTCAATRSSRVIICWLNFFFLRFLAVEFIAHSVVSIMGREASRACSSLNPTVVRARATIM